MNIDTISISSDEDVPLNTLASPHTNLSSTACLKTHCVQQCEFCDEVFLNRYTAIIHNAQHIIIPLLKQNVYQCMECLYYFTSQIELKHHKETKHEKEIANESDNNIKSEKFHMAISDIVKKELDVKLEDYLIQNILKSPVKIKEEINIKEEVIEENYVSETVDENVNGHVSEAKFKISNRLQFEDDSDDSDINDETVLDDKVFNMGGNGLLNDLTTVCKVNINLYDKPWVENAEDIKIETLENYVKNGVIVPATVGNIEPSIVECKTVDTLDNNVNNGVIVDASKNIEASIVEYAPSIHFEDLIKPGMYRCRRCSDSFPTRFQLIQHDMSHVKIRKSRPLLCIYCERFISNTRALLKKHVDEQHPTECSPRPNQFPNCKKCGLKYYSYSKHTKNYHIQLLRSEREGHAPKKWRPVTFCNWCNRAFYSEEEKQTHINTKHLVEKKCQQCGMVSTAIEIQEHQKICKPSVFLDNFNVLGEPLCYNSTLKLCKTCCLFLKSKNKTQYTIVKSISEEGVRLTCEQCGKKHFELKLVVRRMVVLKKKEKQAEKERKKHLSNSERLKNIQQRLKMINKLSRY